jgi:transposase-like protein
MLSRDTKSQKAEKEPKKKFELRAKRTFSEEFKKQKVKELVNKQISIGELSKLYDVSTTSVYRWLYKYSPHHKRGTTQVVQMESEAQKTKLLQQRVAELERIVGQKQIEIDFLNELITVAGAELKVDLKKTFCTKP